MNGNPVKRLVKILEQPIGQRSQLERAHPPELSQILAGVESDKDIERLYRDFRDIFGSIVLLASPLSTVSLAKLLHIEKADVDDQLRCLYSVLWVPSDPNARVHLLHLSFREFLVKESHSDLGRKFTIKEPTS